MQYKCLHRQLHAAVLVGKKKKCYIGSALGLLSSDRLFILYCLGSKDSFQITFIIRFMQIDWFTDILLFLPNRSILLSNKIAGLSIRTAYYNKRSLNNNYFQLRSWSPCVPFRALSVFVNCFLNFLHFFLISVTLTFVFIFAN